MADSISCVEVGSIEPLILAIRNKRVIVDVDLAKLYGVSTKALNQAVTRNRDRFPDDFCFHLTKMEKMELVTDCDRFKKLKHSTSLPRAFSEFGAIMVASVLNSPQAVRTSVFVVRAFVRMREFLAAGVELALELAEIRNRVEDHERDISDILDAIQLLTDTRVERVRRIGFRIDD
jgi:hypothetical protein